MPFSIYPPIGVARLGNSDEFYIGPEAMDSMGVEIVDGIEQPVTSFKDDRFRMKKQAARFRVFETSEGSDPKPAELPDGAQIKWIVNLANRKDAVQRPSSPPEFPTPVKDDPSRQNRLIEGEGEVVGAQSADVNLVGSYLDQQVKLATIMTDADQNLILLAGDGNSQSPENPPAPLGGGSAGFYNNPGWLDDIADGSIRALITLPNGQTEMATSAWVVTAPPDFSPPSGGVVTFYDMLKQVALDSGWITKDADVSFETDIRPMIGRTASLRWVHAYPTWSAIIRDWSALADPSPENERLRQGTRRNVLATERVIRSFTVQAWQKQALNAWASGNFLPEARPDRGSCDELTRAALDNTLGQGLYPGIEGGINFLDPGQFEDTNFEFRLKPGALRPGDATAHMALPWQADFLKCSSGWWPAQRPSSLPLEDGGSDDWLRPPMNHEQLVENVMRLGVATPVGEQQVIERGRDPSF